MAEKKEIQEGGTFYSEQHGLWGIVLPGGSVAAMVDNEVPAVFKHLDRIPSDAIPVEVELSSNNVNLEYVSVLNVCKHLVAEIVPMEQLVEVSQ